MQSADNIVIDKGGCRFRRALAASRNQDVTSAGFISSYALAASEQTITENHCTDGDVRSTFAEARLPQRPDAPQRLRAVAARQTGAASAGEARHEALARRQVAGALMRPRP